MMKHLVAALFTAIFLTGAYAADFVAVDPKPIEFAVRDREGVVHDQSEFQSRLTLLHFWASWCLPCLEELPALARLQADLGKEGVKIVAVSVDRLGWGAIDRTVAQLDVAGLEIFHDLNREAAQGLGVEGLPLTIVVDGEGREVARLLGQGDWSAPDLRRSLHGFLMRED